MELTYAEVVERVRATIARYAQALDDGRTDDIVATFCPDGVCDIPGMGTHTGHEALREAFTKWKPRLPQRHLVLNTLVSEWDQREATAISDVVFLLWEDTGWAIKLVGRYHDVFHHGAGVWLLHHRTATFVSEPPPAGRAA